MGAQHAPLSINDLPPAVLARIFALTHPRRDGLALLLTCRHWLGVAEAECPQHLWGVVLVHSNDQRLVKQHAQAGLLAGLRRRAACLAELRVLPRQGWAMWETNFWGLKPLWLQLLQAMDAMPWLHSIYFKPTPSAYNTDYFVSICEALHNLTSLKHLIFHVGGWTGSELPLSALRLFSTLTRLEELELRLNHSTTGGLPSDLLPALANLTRVDLELGGLQPVVWHRPDGSGPMLRQLKLKLCDICMSADRLLHALLHVERLELVASPLTERERLSILTQLDCLTFLQLWMEVPWPAVLCCSGLRELDAGYARSYPPREFSPSSLPQLTRLTIPSAYAFRGWLALPQLRSLDLIDWSHWSNLTSTLRYWLQLEELHVRAPSLREVTEAISSLARLTRLVVDNESHNRLPQGLREGPYLAGLRQLEISTFCTFSYGEGTWHLPVFLAAATSLELLDLSRDSSLRLRGAEDAALLRGLPRLRRVLLPLPAEGREEAVAAVQSIREALQGDARGGVGPSHAVEVEGVLRGEGKASARAA